MIKIILISSFFSMIFGCTKSPEDRGYTFMPDMDKSPALEAYGESDLTKDGKSMLDPVKGTIARGKMPYHLSNSEADAIKAGTELVDPTTETEFTVSRGQKAYENYCSACHGMSMEGDGPVIAKKFPAPPSLKSSKYKEYSKGRIFHVITVGFGDMPGHANQVTINDRWYISQFIKKMQK